MNSGLIIVEKLKQIFVYQIASPPPIEAKSGSTLSLLIKTILSKQNMLTKQLLNNNKNIGILSTKQKNQRNQYLLRRCREDKLHSMSFNVQI